MTYEQHMYIVYKAKNHMKKPYSCHAQYRNKYWYVQICFRGIDRAPTKPSKVTKSKQYYSAPLTVVDKFFGCVVYTNRFVFVLVPPFAGSAIMYSRNFPLFSSQQLSENSLRMPGQESNPRDLFTYIATLQLSYAKLYCAA